MPPSLTIFLKLFGGFLVFGAIAAAVVAWLPRWAEAMSNHVLDWRIGVGLVAIGFLVWRFVPAAWQPAILIPLLGIAFVAIPMIVGILLFPVETRDGQPVDPMENPPTGPTLVDRLRGPWSSATPARPPAILDLAESALRAYETPVEWQACVSPLGFTDHVVIVEGSHKGVVLIVGDEAVIAFQGTDDSGDWFTNLDKNIAPPPADAVHGGFLEAYRSVAKQVKGALAGAGIKHAWVTGHSLGGAMAVVCAIDLVREGKVGVRGVITFGQPLLLAPSFAPEANGLLAGRFLRLIHEDDLVPRIVPGFRGGGSSMWLKKGELVFNGPRMRAFAANGDDAAADHADVEAGPQPLTDEEFEREKARRRTSRDAPSEPAPGEPPRMQALPNTADHPMTRYLEAIKKRFPQAQPTLSAATTATTDAPADRGR